MYVFLQGLPFLKVKFWKVLQVVFNIVPNFAWNFALGRSSFSILLFLKITILKFVFPTQLEHFRCSLGNNWKNHLCTCEVSLFSPFFFTKFEIWTPILLQNFSPFFAKGAVLNFYQLILVMQLCFRVLIFYNPSIVE